MWGIPSYPPPSWTETKVENCSPGSTTNSINILVPRNRPDILKMDSKYIFMIIIKSFSTEYEIKFVLFMQNKANLRDLIAATGLVISNWIQIVNFSGRVTVKFDGWPCKTIGHLFYATSSFVHLFVPIGEFKLKLQSGNAQSVSNWMIFRAVRPWNLTDDLAIQ